MEKEIAVSILLTSTLILSLLTVAAPTTYAQATVVRFYPQPPPQATITANGQTFTVACVIEDVADLAGFDIQIRWDPTYLSYVSHTVTVTVEDYPTQQVPSPYAGIIHAPKLQLKDDVDPVAGTAWFAYATLGGPSFNGNGTVFTMTFSSQNVPFDFEVPGAFDTFINHTIVDLAAGAGGAIPRTVEDGIIHIVPRIPSYPREPLLKVDSYHASSLHEIFDINVWLLGADDTELDPIWDVAGIDAYLHFDPTLMQVVDVTIDPVGEFAGFWPLGIFPIAKVWDNTAGTVYVAFIGYGHPHTAPYGVINMFSVTFNATYVATTLPPPSAAIYLENPVAYTGSYVMDSLTGLIDRANPVGTTWHELSPDFSDGPFTLAHWEDNGDGILSPSDQVILTEPADYYFDYHLDHITGMLHLTPYPSAPEPCFVEFRGTYDDFLAALSNPNATMWDDVHYFCQYILVDWADNGDGLLSPSDNLTFYDACFGGDRAYHIEAVSTDIGLSRKPWICEEDPYDPYFGWAPIVTVAGYPHPERLFCPWHGSEAAVPLPHRVEDGLYTAPFKPLGGFIDVYVCNYPDGFNGAGKDAPADMVWPQKEIMLCANVTYAGWPEQNKDVAFEVKDPALNVWGVFYNRTNEDGIACVHVRLPWPCDDPYNVTGVWTVWASVDVACVVVNDTMPFKYNYRVHIWDVETDKAEYRHGEDIIITIHYGSQAMQTYIMTFTVTAVDASGVSFGFDYVVAPVGGAEWCTYANGTVVLSVQVAKFARPPIGTIYVGVLNGFPQDGGSAETPVHTVQVSILAE
jgi:hypothetical protein